MVRSLKSLFYRSRFAYSLFWLYEFLSFPFRYTFDRSYREEFRRYMQGD